MSCWKDKLEVERMLTWKDATSGNIVVAVDEEEQYVLLSTGGGDSYRQLAVFSWDEDRRCLEDILDGVERILHKKDGGIWHLGDEPLEDADVDMSAATIESLPFRRLAFVMRDYERDELIAQVKTQRRLGVATVQAYVGKTATGQVTLVERGMSEVITDENADQWGLEYFVNLGPQDVCKVRTTLDGNPAATLSWRGGARLRSLRDGSPGQQLRVLDHRSYPWEFEGESNLVITFTGP